MTVAFTSAVPSATAASHRGSSPEPDKDEDQRRDDAGGQKGERQPCTLVDGFAKRCQPERRKQLEHAEIDEDFHAPF